MVFVTPIGLPIGHRNDAREFMKLLVPAGALVVTLDEAHHDATVADLRREQANLLAEIGAELDRRLPPAPK